MAEDLFPSPHPLTPPHCEEERLAWLRLLRSRRVGATTFHRLMREHGSAADALAALPGVARAAGVHDYHPCPESVAEAELRAARRAGAQMVAIGSPEYPPLLAQLPDAPPILWALGDASLLQRPLLAMVGARNASSLGTRMARRLAAGLGEAGHVVVSGLARGIDAAAHLAALEHGTIAVMAGGVDVIYPTENAALAGEIAERGLRISEQPFGLLPRARHFPQRNRIISGLAAGVVVVEAAARSGSLITARGALDQGREVFAVPGHPFDGRASGCNMLIRDGATLVRGPEDVIDALADGHPATRDAPTPAASPTTGADTAADAQGKAGGGHAPHPVPPVAPAALRARILRHLGPSPLAEDQLIRDMKLPPSVLSPELTFLELEGKVSRQPGGLISLAAGAS